MCRGPRVPGKKIKNNFPVAVQIKTSQYLTLECYINTANFGLNPNLTVLPSLMCRLRSDHIHETFNRFADLDCELRKNAFGGRAPPGLAGGSYSAPPDILAVIRGGK